MAFPVVADTAGSSLGSNNTSHTLTHGLTIAEGDLLVWLVGVNNYTMSLTWPTGFNQLFSTVDGAAAYKIATASEPSSYTLTNSYATRWATRLVRITGHDSATNPPEAASVNGGTNTNINPPSLTPAGGSKEYMWLAVAYDNRYINTIASYPTNYNDNQIYAGGADVKVGMATRNLEAASDDPGSFVVNLSSAWVAATIAVYPVGTSAYSADLTSAAFSMTAQPLTHLAEFAGELSAGAFNFAGQQLDVKEGYSAELSAGAFNFAANDLDTQADYQAELTAPSFSFTPQDLEVADNQALELAAALFNFAAPSITITDPVQMQLGSAAFKFQAYPVTVPGDPTSGSVTSGVTDGQGVIEPITDGNGIT